jgi:hypothetical protein
MKFAILSLAAAAGLALSSGTASAQWGGHHGHAYGNMHHGGYNHYRSGFAYPRSYPSYGYNSFGYGGYGSGLSLFLGRGGLGLGGGYGYGSQLGYGGLYSPYSGYGTGLYGPYGWRW